MGGGGGGSGSEEKRGGGRAGGIEGLTASCQIRNDFINSSCCFQKTSLEGNIVQMLECVGGGCLPNAVSTTSKIAVCKEISLKPSYFERKASGVEGIVG